MRRQLTRLITVQSLIDTPQVPSSLRPKVAYHRVTTYVNWRLDISPSYTKLNVIIRIMLTMFGSTRTLARLWGHST